MVLTQGIIIEESTKASGAHNYVQHGRCENTGDLLSKRHKDCLKFKEADRWYYVVLFAAAIVLVLCSFATLLLFGDWILFVLPVRIVLFEGVFVNRSLFGCVKDFPILPTLALAPKSVPGNDAQPSGQICLGKITSKLICIRECLQNIGG